MGRIALFSLLALLAACEGSPSGSEGSPDCDNLDESHCLFPFPSNRFLPAGPRRIELPLAAMPLSTAPKHVDPTRYGLHDGFSTVTPILFHLEGATLTGVATKGTIDSSLAATSKTVIIDTETGERWPHFAEFDYLAERSAPTLVLRVAKPLLHDHRYVVAIRGLVDADGATLPATRGFASLRDHAPSAVVGVEERQARFDAEVFPVLEKAGIARSGLQLAWDFTTTSEDNPIHLLLAMRDKLFAAIGEDGPEYTITKVEDRTDGPIAKVVTGIAKVPSFLLPKDPDGIKRVRLDAMGEPMLDGTMDTEFTLQIPRSALTSPTPAAIMQYGHGFLGGKSEANTGWLADFANERNFLVIAIDMEGMNEEAAVTWFSLLPSDLSTAPLLSEWPHQGIMNHLAIQRMVKGRLFKDTDPRYTKAGAPYYDRDRLYYHGNSQGGTIGNIVVANSIDVKRAVFGVPGTAFSFLVHRANQWQLIASALAGRYPGTRDMSAIMGLVQIAFDRFEPSYYAAHMSQNPFPGAPAHEVLLQAALGDAQVNNDVSQLNARIIGAKLVEPALRPVWGLESKAAPFAMGNGYVEFDFGVALDQTGNRPEATDTDTHGLPRKSKQAQAQSWAFFETGTITHTCEGACDPS